MTGEGVDARPMSKGSGNAEVEGGASKLDSRYGEVVRVDDRPEGAVQHEGDDDRNNQPWSDGFLAEWGG